MTTVLELKKLAKKKGLSGYSSMKKTQLLRVLGKSPIRKSPIRKSPKFISQNSKVQKFISQNSKVQKFVKIFPEVKKIKITKYFSHDLLSFLTTKGKKRFDDNYYYVSPQQTPDAFIYDKQFLDGLKQTIKY